VFWLGTVGGVLTRGLITLAVSTGLIDLQPHYQFLYDNSLWVMRDDRVSFSRLLLFFFWHFLGFWCHIQFVTTRSLLALAALLGSYSASYRACVSAWLM